MALMVNPGYWSFLNYFFSFNVNKKYATIALLNILEEYIKILDQDYFFISQTKKME